MPPEDIDMEYQDQMNEEERKLEEQMKDWVRVVRCKDCKYLYRNERTCDYFETLVEDDDYCSYGERADDNQ